MAISSVSSANVYATGTVSSTNAEDSMSAYFEALKEKQEELEKLQEEEDSDEETQDQIEALQEEIASIRETLGMDETDKIPPCPPPMPIMDEETMARLEMQYSDLQIGYNDEGDSVIQQVASTFNVEA